LRFTERGALYLTFPVALESLVHGERGEGVFGGIVRVAALDAKGAEIARQMSQPSRA
jgi:hypothetical protein